MQAYRKWPAKWQSVVGRNMLAHTYEKHTSKWKTKKLLNAPDWKMGKNKTVVTQTRVTCKGNKKRRKNIEHKTTAYRKKPSKPTDILWYSRKKKSVGSHMGKMLRAVLGSAGLVNSGGSKKNVATRGYACCPRCKRQQATWRVLLALARQCCFPQPHFTKWSGWSTCRPQPKMQRKNVEKRSRIQRVRKGKGKKKRKGKLSNHSILPPARRRGQISHNCEQRFFSSVSLFVKKKKWQSGTPPPPQNR